MASTLLVTASSLPLMRSPTAVLRPIDNTSPQTLIARGSFSLATPTSAIPLTTSFSAPASCFAPSYTLPPDGLDNVTSLAAGFATIWKGITADCYPPSFSEMLAGQSGLASYYSPAVCPENYVTIGYTSGDSDRNTATCCPIVTASDLVDGVITQPLPYIGHVCNAHDDALEVTVFGDQYTSGLTRISAWKVYYTPITVVWGNRDFATTLVPTLINGTSETVSHTTTTTFGPGQSTDLAPTSSGLSTGAKAGIGVGAAAGALILLAIIIAFLWRQRSSRRKPAQQEVRAPDTYEKAELSGEGQAMVPKASPEAEVEDSAIHEIDGGRTAARIPSVRHELEGDWRGWEAEGEERQGKEDKREDPSG